MAKKEKAKEKERRRGASTVEDRTLRETVRKHKKEKAKDAIRAAATTWPGTATWVGVTEKEKGQHSTMDSATSAANTDMTEQAAGQEKERAKVKKKGSPHGALNKQKRKKKNGKDKKTGKKEAKR